MKNDSNEDAYTHSVLNRIDPEIRSSLSPIQISAIKEAVSSGRPDKRHPLNIRIAIPLLFVNYYLVLFGGRDKRRVTGRVENELRKKLGVASGFVLFLIALLPILVFMFLLLYFIKSAIGINLMPETHLSDLLGV
jgi:hypothetical protein